MTTHSIPLLMSVLAATASAAAPTTHVLEDFESGLGENWAAWGEHGGSIKLAESPDGEGKCLLWTFNRPAGAKKPSGLSWRGIKLPADAKQAIGWALEFSVRGAAPGEGGIYLTLNESDRSCWRTVQSANVTWQQIDWDRVRIPMAALTYAWGNREREGTAFGLRDFVSVTLAIKGAAASAVYLDDFRLVGVERSGQIMGSVLSPDFSAPPLNLYGRDTRLPTGVPRQVEDVVPATGAPSRVVLRDDGVVLLNGKPFLPLGIFCVPNECHGEVAAAGFNTLLNYRGAHKQGKEVRTYLDRCAQYGLMGVVDVQTFTKCAKSGRLESDGLADLVRRSEDHPALLAYYIADEPEYGKVPPEDYVKGYEIIKEIDPHHPVIMLNNRFSAIAEYVAACDLLMPDPYPGFYQVDGPMRSLTTQGKTVLECLRHKPTRPWFTPQFHNGLCYGNRNRERGDIIGRAPTLVELRFELYSAVVHGARGIIGWPFEAAGWSVRDAPEYLRGLKAVVAEMAALGPAMTSTDVKPVQVRDSGVTVKAMVSNHDGHQTIIAINDSAKPSKVTYASRPGAERLHVMSEGRTVSLRKGQFSDAFGPWDVHIYTTDAKLAETSLAKLLPAYVEAFSMAGTVHPTRNTNLAFYLHGSRASASSTNRWARANAVINGSYATTWRADERADEHWIAVDFRRKVTVSRVVLVRPCNADGTPYPDAGGWALATKSGDGAWSEVEGSQQPHHFVQWNPEQDRWERVAHPSARPRRATELSFEPRPTTAIRFAIRAPKSRPTAYEIEAYTE